mmetsp:Transcript_67153/g.185025  ORF Transcript_67153/g.185025 Transcript_67153/m.185025 type:complete len:227 (+) Transcript_67153:453-1133(+)
MRPCLQICDPLHSLHKACVRLCGQMWVYFFPGPARRLFKCPPFSGTSSTSGSLPERGGLRLAGGGACFRNFATGALLASAPRRRCSKVSAIASDAFSPGRGIRAALVILISQRNPCASSTFHHVGAVPWPTCSNSVTMTATCVTGWYAAYSSPTVGSQAGGTGFGAGAVFGGGDPVFRLNCDDCRFCGLACARQGGGWLKHVSVDTRGHARSMAPVYSWGRACAWL